MDITLYNCYNFHIFWTTWGILMKFSGKVWINIKSHKKARLHLLSEKCSFGKTTAGGVKLTSPISFLGLNGIQNHDNHYKKIKKSRKKIDKNNSKYAKPSLKKLLIIRKSFTFRKKLQKLKTIPNNSGKLWNLYAF